MIRVERRESGRIRRAEPTPQGGLKLEAYPSRTGVLTYLNADGTTTRELRLPKEVFAPASLESIKHAPVTDRHPEGRVSPENFREHVRGYVTDAVAPASDGVHVSAELIVQDAEMLRMIDDGDRSELSLGYSVDLDPTPGVYKGVAYDAVQRGIVVNHVAILPPGEARGGPTCALRLDARNGRGVDRIDGVTVEADPSTTAAKRLLANLDDDAELNAPEAKKLLAGLDDEEDDGAEDSASPRDKADGNGRRSHASSQRAMLERINNAWRSPPAGADRADHNNQRGRISSADSHARMTRRIGR